MVYKCIIKYIRKIERGDLMNSFDQAYHDLCRRVLETGKNKDDRTNTGTLSVFGHQMRFDLSKGFPLLTTKKFLLSLSQRSLYGL